VCVCVMVPVCECCVFMCARVYVCVVSVCVCLRVMVRVYVSGNRVPVCFIYILPCLLFFSLFNLHFSHRMACACVLCVCVCVCVCVFVRM